MGMTKCISDDLSKMNGAELSWCGSFELECWRNLSFRVNSVFRRMDFSWNSMCTDIIIPCLLVCWATSGVRTITSPPWCVFMPLGTHLYERDLGLSWYVCTSTRKLVHVCSTTSVVEQCPVPRKKFVAVFIHILATSPLVFIYVEIRQSPRLPPRHRPRGLESMEWSSSGW